MELIQQYLEVELVMDVSIETVLPDLIFGISADTIAVFAQNTKEKLEKEN